MCEDALSTVTDCYAEHECGNQSSACSDEDDRYEELCVREPRANNACSFAGRPVAYGCFPPELSGFRGRDCEATCVDAARDLECAEAIIALAGCLPDQDEALDGCPLLDTPCEAKARAFARACDGFAPVAPDPDELAFCDEATHLLCSCGLESPTPCDERTKNQCFIGAWAGEPCPTLLENLRQCMLSLAVCSRQTVGELCGEASNAFRQACP